MPIPTTTPAAIRVAVRDAVRGISVDHARDSSERWIYTEDDQPTGRRNFTIVQDPATHVWFTGNDAAHGGTGTSHSYEMRIRVGYGGLPRAEAEDRAMSDYGALFELLHPAPKIDNGVLSFIAEGEPPAIEEVVEREEGGPIYDFVFQVHYMRAHAP